MNIHDTYLFTDFTLNNYQRLLHLAKGKYNFCNYLNFNNNPNEIIWRHDVEFSTKIAFEMAKLEAEVGISAIYFVNLHSKFYSAMEKESFKEIKEIIKLGHEIGLHFDCHFYDIKNKQELIDNLEREKEILEVFFNVKLSAFSYHNTTPEILAWNDQKIAGLINVYSKFFREEVHYCTDSTGIWRYERLEDKLKEERECGLQVLTHDGMWQPEVMSPRQRVFKCIDDRASKLKEDYDVLLKKHKQKNVDWDKVD